MGVALGDYDRDGFTDFYVTNIDDAGAAQEQRRRHLQRPRPRCRRGAGQDRRPRGQLGRLGTAFLDYDNDADQDLYLAAGYLDTDQDTNPVQQPNALFRNEGDGTFTDLPPWAGGANDTGFGRGAAYYPSDCPTERGHLLEYIPDGRDRLGFDYFRAYNYHTQYFDGPICLDGGGHERWRGYNTTGLLPYVEEFLDPATETGEPFCLFVAPHMPHLGGVIPGGRVTQDASPSGRPAPDDCLSCVPERPWLPANVPPELLAEATDCYRDYLAMTVAVDATLKGPSRSA